MQRQAWTVPSQLVRRSLYQRREPSFLLTLLCAVMKIRILSRQKFCCCFHLDIYRSFGWKNGSVEDGQTMWKGWYDKLGSIAFCVLPVHMQRQQNPCWLSDKTKCNTNNKCGCCICQPTDANYKNGNKFDLVKVGVVCAKFVCISGLMKPNGVHRPKILNALSFFFSFILDFLALAPITWTLTLKLLMQMSVPFHCMNSIQIHSAIQTNGSDFHSDQRTGAVALIEQPTFQQQHQQKKQKKELQLMKCYVFYFFIIL